MAFKSFKDMDVWKLSMSTSKKVYNLTVNLPKSEDYGLTSQIRRSSNSVSANIAEAFGRRTKKDKIVYYIISRGSAFETQSHLIYGQTVGYFEEKEVKSILNNYDEIIYHLNKILKTLNPNS